MIVIHFELKVEGSMHLANADLVEARKQLDSFVLACINAGKLPVNVSTVEIIELKEIPQ